MPKFWSIFKSLSISCWQHLGLHHNSGKRWKISIKGCQSKTCFKEAPPHTHTFGSWKKKFLFILERKKMSPIKSCPVFLSRTTLRVICFNYNVLKIENHLIINNWTRSLIYTLQIIIKLLLLCIIHWNRQFRFTF